MTLAAPHGKEDHRPVTRWLMAGALALALAALVATAARAQPAHGYVLEARLEPSTHQVHGAATLTWTNESVVPAEEIWLHLYLNAFHSDETVFMTESGGQLRGVEREGDGHIELLSLELSDGTSLLEDAGPGDHPGDTTELRVPLPTPVPPGGVLELRTTFLAQLPPVFARSGYHDDFHVVAQWFPKIARREPDGRWATFPYHARGEFYADFAHYELEVVAPEGWIIGATGEMQGETTSDGQVVRRFRADNVHDAAFVAAPWFLERARDVDGVQLRILYPPGYGWAVDRHEAVTVAALAHYGQRYGDYPYSTLTVVVPPRGAAGAAGMEYPTLFITAGPWFDVPGVHLGVHDDVTAHELAHQWFQGMVATNEVEAPWLDEGLTSWATYDFLQAQHGREGSAVDLLGVRLDVFELLRGFALRSSDPVPTTPAHGFQSNSSYARAVYVRPALALESIARTWGRERISAGLGTYAREHRFGHPTREQLYRALDGAYWPGFSSQVLVPAMEGGELCRLSTAREGGALSVSRACEPAFPTHVLVERADGSSERLPWPAGAAPPVLPSGAKEVRVDPDRALLLDDDRFDDTTARGPGFFAQLLFVAQTLLGALGA